MDEKLEDFLRTINYSKKSQNWKNIQKISKLKKLQKISKLKKSTDFLKIHVFDVKWHKNP